MKNFRYLAVFTCFIMSSTIFARIPAVEDVFDQINNSMAFGIQGLYLNYGERTTDIRPTWPPQTNDTEKGIIGGLVFNARTTFFKKIYTDFSCDYSTGKLKYDGAEEESGNHNPYQYRSEHKIFNVDVKAGYILIDYKFFQIIPYLGAGYRYWDRASNSTINREKYNHFNYILGIKLNYSLNDDWFISPYFNLEKMFRARMKDAYGKNYTLGNKPIYQGGLEINYRLFDEVFLQSFVNYTHFEYGRSSSLTNVPAEPDSKTNELKVGIGVRCSWLP